MKRQPPPLRFLAVVVGLWVCGRAAVLAPDSWVDRGAAAAPSRGSSNASAPPAAAAGAQVAAPAVAPAAPSRPLAVPILPAAGGRPPPRLAIAPPPAPLEIVALQPLAAARPAPSSAALLPRAAARPVAAPVRTGRWSASAWLLLRNDRAAALAPGGMLGGSQGGLRVTYRLNGDPGRPLAASARLYAPVRNRAAAEAALGLDWRPTSKLPVHVLLERRQAIGRDGRSAFALSVHGGIDERPLVRGVSLDAYVQAGVVGVRSRHLFAYGAARVSIPAAGARIGVVAWGGAPPGATRLDAGPQASIRLPVAGERVRVSAEWRFRIAGDARPGSGPVLTLGSDF